MSQSQVQKLCQILVESNLQLCQTVREGRINVHELCEHFEKIAIQIDKLSKRIKENYKYMIISQDAGKSDELSIMTKNLLN